MTAGGALGLLHGRSMAPDRGAMGWGWGWRWVWVLSRRYDLGEARGVGSPSMWVLEDESVRVYGSVGKSGWERC